MLPGCMKTQFVVCMYLRMHFVFGHSSGMGQHVFFTATGTLARGQLFCAFKRLFKKDD